MSAEVSGPRSSFVCCRSAKLGARSATATGAGSARAARPRSAVAASTTANDAAARVVEPVTGMVDSSAMAGELLPEAQQVAPDQPLLRRLAQQVGRMESDRGGDRRPVGGLVGVGPPAQLGDAFGDLEQAARRAAAQKQ